MNLVRYPLDWGRMGPSPVVLEGVARRFGARWALQDIDLEVAAGEIVGLAGPNGSGKTTLIRILAGFLAPTRGTARVLGLEPFGEQARVMRHARFAFAPPALYLALTAREHLRHLASLGRAARERPRAADVERVLDEVGLRERADERVGTFSFGMRQRLVLAQALLPTPELLVLDEPTDGLDPLAVLELRAVLQRLNAEHRTTIVLSSHLLVEVEQLVDRLLVLSEGRALFLGASGDLTRGHERLHLQVDDAQRARELLVERGLSVRTDGDGGLEVEQDSLTLGEASELLRAAGLVLESFHLRRPSLEEALLRRLRESRERTER